MSTKHRAAIIGLGMAHGPHLKSLRDLSDRVEIAAAYTPSPARRDGFARANPDLAVVDSMDAILADRSIDVVLVLTPPRTHLELVERCAAAGKHVLLEKPVEVTAERARKAVEAMERAGRRLAIMLQSRFRQGSRHLAGLMRGGELGDLLSGSASIRWWRPSDYFAQPGRGMKERDGGGVLLTQAIHTLDLFLSLAGPVDRVAAMAVTSPLRRIDTEDVVAAAVSFAGGAIGTIDATTVAYPGFSERIELACGKGTAVLTAGNLVVHWKDGREERHGAEQGSGGGADPMAFPHHAHRDLIADLLEAIDGDREPEVSGRDALKVHVLIEALLASAESRRTVTLP
ncbi:MAG: Gfo/Idh/MocA family oxidoreductase [Alphaproteobacteria bacterium]|nr:Gfo/Idh/MocA family oxidoreductase [Alphaproteobacteria bacterium]